MNFIKNHKKIISLFLVTTFFYLIQITAMPLNAETSKAPNSETMSSASNEPGLVEQEAPAGHAKKKSSIFPIIIGVVAIGAIAAILVLVASKTKYDITGTWSETDSIASNSTNITFTGSKKSGTVYMSTGETVGTYTVDSKTKTVHFGLLFDDFGYVDDWVFDGQFDSKDKMSGTFKLLATRTGTTSIGTWSATRGATPTSSSDKKATMIKAPAKEVK